MDEAWMLNLRIRRRTWHSGVQASRSSLNPSEPSKLSVHATQLCCRGPAGLWKSKITFREPTSLMSSLRMWEQTIDAG